MAESIPDVEPSNLAANLAAYQKECLLLDVREPGEYEAGHIQGAINVPVGSLEERIAELSKEKKILAICRSGARAQTAARILMNKGFSVGVMKGGMRSWTGALER
jgi:rhodanese-related sulfurtransferase